MHDGFGYIKQIIPASGWWAIHMDTIDGVEEGWSDPLAYWEVRETQDEDWPHRTTTVHGIAPQGKGWAGECDCSSRSFRYFTWSPNEEPDILPFL